MELSKLKEIHDFLIQIAYQAGSTILAADPSIDAAGSKKNIVDLVTETDKAVEALVSKELKQQYPDIAFIGEETYVPGQTNLTSAPTFIVDPIDGTTNFVHGYPYVSISLGLSIDFTPYIGVVYNPFTGHLYSAIRGQGATLTRTFVGSDDPANGPRRVDKLPLRNPPEKLGGVQSALLCVEWGSDRSGNDMAVKAHTFARLARAREEENGAMVHSLRSFGSAALNLCGVAAGQLDAYWEAGCWAWDVCAGWCILTEAGGVMVGANPGEWKADLEGRRYFAVRGDGNELRKDDSIGLAITEGQRSFVEEFWWYVEGRFEVGLRD